MKLWTLSYDSGNRDSHSTGLPKHDQIDAARATVFEMPLSMS